MSSELLYVQYTLRLSSYAKCQLKHVPSKHKFVKGKVEASYNWFYVELNDFKCSHSKHT